MFYKYVVKKMRYKKIFIDIIFASPQLQKYIFSSLFNKYIYIGLLKENKVKQIHKYCRNSHKIQNLS